ncbi:MAG: PEP-CTERM sorting domain-containing protein [Planctomycetia bacterium]|nr:PEP-CTERM sorting domain-containing protein [Planctomycetia bacterium]
MTGPEAGELFWLGDEDGQAFGYNNWQPREPNAWVNENYAHVGWHAPDTWNDYTDTHSTTRNYIVEFSPVPEPSTYTLLSIGGVALALHSRRRGG